MTHPTLVRFAEPAYGTSTPDQRSLWQDAINALVKPACICRGGHRQDDPVCRSTGGADADRAIREEIDRMKVAATNYATGWYDAVKGGLDQADRDRMFELIWPFAEEVGYAYYLFLTGRTSARYGHALAWEQALKTLKPQGNEALGS